MLGWLKDAFDMMLAPSGVDDVRGVDDHPSTPMAGMERQGNPTDEPDWHNGFGTLNDQQAAAEWDNSFSSSDWTSSGCDFGSGGGFDNW